MLRVRSRVTTIIAMPIRYKFKDGNILAFADGVIETLRKYRQTRRMNEAGGILLGRVFAPSGQWH